MKDYLSLDNRIAIVTGAGGGLGSSFAEILAEAGARVALCGRRRDSLETTAERIQAAGGHVAIVPLDVTDVDSIAAGFDTIESELGVVDIAVCNAGIAKPTLAIDASESDWLDTIEVNLNGCWRIAQETAKRLKKADKGGSIINVSSILAHRVATAAAAYAASKGALEQLTRSLALEWARLGIRVNALAPGYVETDLNRDFFKSEAGAKMVGRIPQKRLGQPHELAIPLLLLASDAGSYMTGSTLVVDGGHLQSSL